MHAQKSEDCRMNKLEINCSNAYIKNERKFQLE